MIDATITITFRQLREREPYRPIGYMADVIRRAVVVSEDSVTLTNAAYMELMEQYRPPRLPPQEIPEGYDAAKDIYRGGCNC